MVLKTNWNAFSKNRDAIYGIAIISIMIFHFFEDVASSDFLGGGVAFAAKIYNMFIGSVGVEFFVFLSGIGLYFSMTKDSNVLHFFYKRVKRILPTYFVVAILYWCVEDFVIKQNGLAAFIADISFATFFTQGTRTFWYVLFILLAYLSYPCVYKFLHTELPEHLQLLALIATALVIQFLPKAIVPTLYANIEILLGRFLIFFIGCWSGKKVYKNERITKREQMGFLFGFGLMLGDHLPIIKCVVSKMNHRSLMCFWGIFLLYFLAVNLEKGPQKLMSFLQRFGKSSYELYLTHVAIRAYMNTIGLRTCYLQNYILCIAVSIGIVFTIVRLQRQRRKINAA